MRNFFSLLFVGMTILMSCSKENGSPIDGPLKSSAKVLLSFDFTIADNSGLTEDFRPRERHRKMGARIA